MSTAVRLATGDDAAAIARVQVATWRSAYAGIFPAPYLEGLNDVRIALGWSETLERRGFVTLVAEDGALAREPVVGFVHGGPSDTRGVAEIYTFYILASHQRQGLGRRLLAAAAAALAPAHRALVIRVLVENAPARAFYQHLGGIVGDVRTLRVGGREIDEIAYDWPDLPALAAALSGERT
ncbi:MAG: GNAT family N-acetyltransferase [Alphaproteobacteria bacterium]|nr:GNAT family N-acetyltransferase [Alphaproteobacteria bacterium]